MYAAAIRTLLLVLRVDGELTTAEWVHDSDCNNQVPGLGDERTGDESYAHDGHAEELDLPHTMRIPREDSAVSPAHRCVDLAFPLSPRLRPLFSPCLSEQDPPAPGY